jgi:hypothetical protein
MSTLENSTRRIPKATLVRFKMDTSKNGSTSPNGPHSTPEDAIMKLVYLRHLNLRPDEVNAVRSIMRSSKSKNIKNLAARTHLWQILRPFENSELPPRLPPHDSLLKIPSTDLLSFGRELVAARRQALERLQQVTPAKTKMSPNSAIAIAKHQLHVATVATNSLDANLEPRVHPIGMLNLERLEMTPAGIERGEILATIPLAPGEKTAVDQKEWSVTSKEFTSIVTDFKENYSETGVTENTELARSTSSETQHSNQFDLDNTVSGSYGFVTASLSTALDRKDALKQGETDSKKHSISVTKKASSRVKQEHKVSITTRTVSGTSVETTRILENTTTNPMRIDYFSMMRKWRVRLYRYGLRLTYDIAIPEPGATLRESYALIDIYQKQAAIPFEFNLKSTDISTDPNNPNYYQTLANNYQLANPPQPPDLQIKKMEQYVSPDYSNNDASIMGSFEISLDSGYEIVSMRHNTNFSFYNNRAVRFDIFEDDQPARTPRAPNTTDSFPGNFPNYVGVEGKVGITYGGRGLFTVSIDVYYTLRLKQSGIDQWRDSMWSALYNAARDAYNANQQAIMAQIQILKDQMSNVDTLTLRREENEEIMKGVLRWLLGPSFDFMPQSVAQLFATAAAGQVAIGGVTFPSPPSPPSPYLTYGLDFTGNELGLSSTTDWSNVVQYGEMVKFINEAVEWENVLYFLYSYFWDVPPSWDFIRGIRHEDARRQAFLRAGSARVVLTIRPGYETDWLAFVDTLKLNSQLRHDHPYLTIAQEIQDYDNTNYPGIPPANPASPNQVSASSNANIAASPNPVTISVDSSAGFVPGSIVTIETPASNVMESQRITAVPDGTHITVQMLKNSHNGTSVPFPITQSGESGSIIDSGQVVARSTPPGGQLAASPNPVTIPVDSSAGFIVGSIAAIDTPAFGYYDPQGVWHSLSTHASNVMEWQRITAVPDGTHITVQMLNNQHTVSTQNNPDGTTTAIPILIVQSGEKGELISEWYEYTPSSGTDIAVTSNLATIS